MSINIQSERLSANAYIDFLKRTNLGSQYPKERFEQRIEKLVQTVSISLVARNENGEIVGMGTHDELMQTNAVYQEIYYSQMEKEGE